MPKYRISYPDGRTFQVEGPEGYTAEQAYRDVHASVGQQQPEAKKPGLMDTLRQNAGGAMQDVGNALTTAAGLTPGMGGQLLSQTDPKEVAGGLTAAADIAGAGPGAIAGGLAGGATALRHLDPQGGLDVAHQVMNEATPSTAMGMQPQGQSIAYDALMKPIEHAMSLGNYIGQGYGNLAAAARAMAGQMAGERYSQSMERAGAIGSSAHATANLTGLVGMATAGVKGMMRGEKRPPGHTEAFDDIRKSIPELKDMSDKEIHDIYQAKEDAAKNIVPPDQGAVDTSRVRNPYGVETNRLAVDENGIPVRAKVSDELAMTQGEEARAPQMQQLESQMRAEQGDPAHATVTPADLQRQQQPMGLTDPNAINGPHPVPDALRGGPSGKTVDFEVPNVDRSLLALEDTKGRPASVNYTNPLTEHVTNRLASVPEVVRGDSIIQRLTTQADLLKRSMNSLVETAGKAIVEGVGTRSGAMDVAKQHAAEAKRLQEEHAYMAQKLDNVLNQLDNRVKTLGGVGKKGFGQGGAINIPGAEGVIRLRESLGKLKRFLMDPAKPNEAVVVFRGLTSGSHNPVEKRTARDGRPYSVFTTENPWLASDYAAGDSRLPKTGQFRTKDYEGEYSFINKTRHLDSFKDRELEKRGPAVFPYVFKKTVKVIEFPVKDGNFDKFAFDEQARKLGKNEVLVARQGYDWGPNNGWDHPQNRDTYVGDQYAFTDPSVVVKAYNKLGGTGKKGFGQGGATNFTGKDPFEKFRDKLPEGSKHLAESIWKTMQESKKPKPGENLVNAKEVAQGQAVAKVLGNAFDKYIPITEDYSKVRDSIVGGKDVPGTTKLGRVGQSTVSGIMMYAQQTGNRAIKFVSDVLNQSVRAQKTAVSNRLFDEGGIIHSFEKLTNTEQGALWKVMKENKMEKWLSPDELKSHGFSEKQIAAYDSARRNLEKLADHIDEARKLNGLPPVKRVPGYFPSRWKGSHYFEVRLRHADGKLQIVRIETGDWKGIAGHGGLSATRNKFLLEHGDKYEVGPIEERPRHGENKDTYGLFNHLLDTIGRDNPDRAALDRIFDQYTQERVDRTKNFRKHLEPNNGVKGFQGDKEAKTDIQNARDAMYALEGYTKDAYDYIESTKAAKQLNKLLYDKEFTESQPNAERYIRRYWDAHKGIETAFSSWVNDVAGIPFQMVGMSRYTPQAAVKNVKKAMMLYFLGFNRPVFLISQNVQPMQFMTPYLFRMQADLGRSGMDQHVLTSQTKGYYDTAMMLTGGEMSPTGKAASDYALANHIVDSYFLDDIGSADKKTVNQLTKFVTGETLLQASEKYSRSIAFFSYTHFLEKAGLTGDALHKAAADATDITMTNYQTQERALMYKEMGIIGELASPLTTFKHNFFSQLYMYGKDIIKNPDVAHAKPLAAFLTNQFIVGGLMGMVFLQEADAIIDKFRELGWIDPRTKNVTQMLATYGDKMGGTAGKVLKYGPFSGLTGMNISPSFTASSLIPDRGLSALMPVPVKAFDMISHAYPVVRDELGRLGGGQGSNQVDRAALLKSIMPPGFQGVQEAINQKPNGMIPNPDKEMTGTVRRGPPSATDPNWVARGLGVHSIPESEQMTEAFQRNLQKAAIKNREHVLLDAIVKKQMSGQDTTPEKREYLSYGNKPEAMIKAINENRIKQNQTALEQSKGIPKTLKDVFKYRGY